ncbi:helix-turn-helix domain-containing protein [Hominenteromicrobium sp.]|uniref:helix-turn-helix domain-containing protein n=1 Tax=Hominenteromicrobium sp. TaxID=3073581 RepID=UPI00204C094A|nr:MAG TPA: helix-turn-helix XRE-family like protein [Caudoviricetes sp.]
MNERLKEARKALDISQEEFASRIGMKGSSFSLLENGKRNITDRVIRDVCREFNVDYIWLTTGKGEMFASDEAEFARLVDRVMENEDEFVRSFFETFASLSAEQWELLKDIARKLSENSTNKNDPE